MKPCCFCGRSDFTMKAHGSDLRYCNDHWPSGTGLVRDWGWWENARRARIAWREDHIWYSPLAMWIRRNILYTDPRQCPQCGDRLPHTKMGWRKPPEGQASYNHSWKMPSKHTPEVSR